MFKLKISGMEEMKGLREVWNHLVSRMGNPSFFCSWEWIYTWCQVFGDKYDLRIIQILKNAEIKGILPLALGKSGDGLLNMKARMLTFCGSKEVYPDHIDIIVDKEYAPECLDALVNYLYSGNMKWDILNLSYIDEDSEIVKCISRLQRKKTIYSVSVAPYICFDDGFDGFMKSFSRKHRYNLNRQRNILETKLNTKFTIIPLNDQEELAKNIGLLFELHKARKEKMNVKSSFLGTEIERFHKTLIANTAGKEVILIASIQKEKEPVAIGYGFKFEEKFLYYQTGLNPEWEKYSAGTVLLLDLIEYACSQGCKEFDFLRGKEKYKSSWTEKERKLMEIILYNDTINGRITESIGRAKQTIKKLKHFSKGLLNSN